VKLAGTAKNGVVVPDDPRLLKEGQRFVLILEDEEEVALSPEELAELNDRLEESERGEKLVSRDQLWASLGRPAP